MKPILQSGIALLCAFALSGCQTTAQKHDPATPVCTTAPAAAVLADDSFRAALWQQSAAEYDALSLQAYARAESMLDLALEQASWSALDPSEKQAAPTGPGLAIITDIDETLVDNSAFTVRQMREPVPSCMTVAQARADWERRWLEWVSDAEATAMPGAAEFMQHAVQRPGVEVFYVTNRKDNEKVATCKNLIAVGFPVKSCDTHVLTRNDAEGRRKDKVSRRQDVARTHRVVLMFGDNLGDFIGNVLTTETERDAIVAKRRDWWGRRWFMLPNPAYGSWEEILGAVTDRPDDFASAAERAAYVRAQKERRLKDCRSRDCLKP